mgnify:CR=1 FL=1
MLIDRVDAAIAAFQVGCEAPRNSVGSTAAEQGLAEEEALKKEGQKSPASSRAASFTPRRDFQVLFARDTSAGKLKTKRGS